MNSSKRASGPALSIAKGGVDRLLGKSTRISAQTSVKESISGAQETLSGAQETLSGVRRSVTGM